jgi:hypothetical protein
MLSTPAFSSPLINEDLPGRAAAELEFLKRLWGLGTGEEEGYRTGPPGYIDWRNSFLGIDSGAPYTFKNTSSGVYIHTFNNRFRLVL